MWERPTDDRIAAFLAETNMLPPCRHGGPETPQCVGCLARRLRGNTPHVESETVTHWHTYQKARLIINSKYVGGMSDSYEWDVAGPFDAHAPMDLYFNIISRIRRYAFRAAAANIQVGRFGQSFSRLPVSMTIVSKPIAAFITIS